MKSIPIIDIEPFLKGDKKQKLNVAAKINTFF